MTTCDSPLELGNGVILYCQEPKGHTGAHKVDIFKPVFTVAEAGKINVELRKTSEA